MLFEFKISKYKGRLFSKQYHIRLAMFGSSFFLLSLLCTLHLQNHVQSGVVRRDTDAKENTVDGMEYMYRERTFEEDFVFGNMRSYEDALDHKKERYVFPYGITIFFKSKAA